MTHEGFLILPRPFFQSPLWNERREYSRAEAWIDLCQKAAFAPHQQYVDGKLFDVDYGQVVASQRFLQNSWCWKSLSKVQKYLTDLQIIGEIEVNKIHGQSLITCCELARYYATKVNERSEKGQLKVNEKSVKGQQKVKEEERKKERTEKREEGVPPQLENFDLLKKIGKDAARMWTEGNLTELLNGKSALALEWLSHLCEIGKPYRSHAQMVALVTNFQKHPAERLRAMMDYSIPAGYPNLYPDFDQKQKQATGGHPDHWDAAHFKKLDTKDHAAYWSHLRSLGLSPKKDRFGNTVDWVKKH